MRVLHFLLFGLLCSWLGGFLWFIGDIPDEHLSNEPADAIVVLTGGSDRLKAGLTLLTQQLAPRLFVSGVGEGVKKHELIEHFKPDAAVSPDTITLGHQSRSTFGNAEETGAWAAAQHIKTIRLVTSYYHMRRSLVEFSAQMPGTRIIPHPVQPTRETFSKAFRLLILEYHKYLVVLARVYLGLPSAYSS